MIYDFASSAGLAIQILQAYLHSSFAYRCKRVSTDQRQAEFPNNDQHSHFTHIQVRKYLNETSNISEFDKRNMQCPFVCVSYPFLSEVGSSGTLLGSGYMVFLSWSRSTWYFRHPDRDKRSLCNNNIKKYFVYERLDTFFILLETHLPSNVEHVCVRVVERKKDSWRTIQVLL